MNNTAESVAQKLNEWFPMWQWSAHMSGGYCCVFAEQERDGVLIGTDIRVRARSSERVARARSWDRALQQAKAWAWKESAR